MLICQKGCYYECTSFVCVCLLSLSLSFSSYPPIPQVAAGEFWDEGITVFWFNLLSLDLELMICLFLCFCAIWNKLTVLVQCQESSVLFSLPQLRWFLIDLTVWLQPTNLSTKKLGWWCLYSPLWFNFYLLVVWNNELCWVLALNECIINNRH